MHMRASTPKTAALPARWPGLPAAASAGRLDPPWPCEPCRLPGLALPLPAAAASWHSSQAGRYLQHISTFSAGCNAGVRYLGGWHRIGASNVRSSYSACHGTAVQLPALRDPTCHTAMPPPGVHHCRQGQTLPAQGRSWLPANAGPCPAAGQRGDEDSGTCISAVAASLPFSIPPSDQTATQAHTWLDPRATR